MKYVIICLWCLFVLIGLYWYFVFLFVFDVFMVLCFVVEYVWFGLYCVWFVDVLNFVDNMGFVVLL